MFQRVVPRVFKARAFSQRNLSKIQSWNSTTVSKSFSTFLEKEHGEEAIFVRRMEAMEAERKKAMRDRIEHIMALEHDHEDKKQLEDLLCKSEHSNFLILSLSENVTNFICHAISFLK